MSQSRWNHTWELFHAASDLEPDERSSYLDTACGGDAALRSEVEDLLRAGEAANGPEMDGEGFLESSAPLAALLADAPGALATSLEPDRGDAVGPYRLVRRLGAGGMGVVWEAKQREPIRRRVALKLIKLGMDSREIVTRFEAERQTLALMEHPGIARVYDAGTTDSGRPYFAMEFVEGEPIDGWCDRQRLAIDQRLRLFAQVLKAVGHAHRKGVIHRDLKPSNILVAAGEGGDLGAASGSTAEVEASLGVAKVIDFGIAKAVGGGFTGSTLATAQGELVGTPEYMSPEQAGLEPDLDTRADVYALGVVLHQLLTGTLPHDLTGRSRSEIERCVREEEPQRPSTRIRRLDDARRTAAAQQRATSAGALRRRLRGDLDWIVLRALARDREERYGTVAELLADIERHLDHQPVLAGPPGALYRLRKFARRHAAGVAVATAVVVLTLVGATLLFLESRRLALALEREAAERATAERVSGFLADVFEASDPYSQEQGLNVTVRQVLDRAARRIDEELAEDPVVQARLMATIGQVYRRLSLADEAAPLLERAWEIRRRELGADHPELAESQQLLSELAFVRGDYARAERLARDALEIRREALPAHDPATAWSLDVVALARRELGDLAAAEELHSEALELRRRAGADARELADSYNYLGIVRRRRFDYRGAESAYRQALELLRRELPEEHPTVGMLQNNLALVLHVAGDHRAAREIFERLLPLREELLGSDHPDVSTTRANFAKLLGDMGAYEEAEEHYLRALATRRRRSGDSHHRVANLLSDYALVLREQGRLEAARSALEEALAIQRAAFGDEHQNVAANLHWLGVLAEREGDPVRAEALLEDAVRIYRSAVGEDDLRLAATRSELGALLAAQKRFEEAEALLLASLRALEAGPPERIEATRRRLVRLYRAWGRPADAERYASNGA